MSKTIRIIFCMVFLFTISFYGYCYSQTDTDTLVQKNNVIKSPNVAIIKSAILPGFGQLYNGKIFKAVLIFGGEVALAGNAVYYNQLQVQSSTEDEWEFYRNIKSRFLWWLFAVHLLNVIDAYVDASLLEFDTGPDLSFYPDFSNIYTLASVKLKL